MANLPSEVLATLVLLAGNALTQSRAIGWGLYSFDSDVSLHTPVAVSAGDFVTTVLTTDGQIYSRGFNGLECCIVPELPAGRRYTQVASNLVSVAIVDDGSLRQWGIPGLHTFTPMPPLPAGVSAVKVNAGTWLMSALLSNGSVIVWGADDPLWQPLAVPALPIGTTYVDVSTGGGHGYALRSDGVWASWGANNWGQRNGPTPPAGVGIAKIAAGSLTTAALLTDGTIQVWGYAPSGQTNVPSPPPGVPFVDVSVGEEHVVGKLADGSLVAWGSNVFGQCNVPPLPQGLTYGSFAAGRNHTVALRSDGVVVSCGHRNFDGPAMAVPPGQTLRTIKTGGFHCLAVTSAGEMLGVGAYQVGQINVPSLPPGVTWVDCAAGGYFSIGLGSDGKLRAFGWNGSGQCNVPALPAGMTYTQVAAGFAFGVALRSDGNVVTWGAAQSGPLPVPPLPSGLTYRAVGACDDFALFLRSDGSIVQSGYWAFPAPAPPLPPGVEYVEVTGTQVFALARRSDGAVVMWNQYSSSMWTPTLPRGQHYVGIAALRLMAFARRSDGTIVKCSVDPSFDMSAPTPPPGMSFHAIDAGWDYLAVATIGSRSSYVGFADGCDASGTAGRIVPSDTPKLGQTLTLRLDRMTTNAGALAFGWTRLLPGTDLGSFGMPGCVAYVVPDAIVPVVGTLGWGRVDMTLPTHPALLGATWFNQALLLDPAANAVGAKLSMAYEAIVGG